MALPQLTIAKNWFTGTTVREVNWDNIRTPLILWAAGINGSITQISRDAFGSGYVINQNGAAILSTSLAQQIANISSGSTPFSGHLKIYNGFDFLMYSDAGVTLKFGIDGATGNTFLYGGGDLSLFSGGDIFTYSDVGVTPTFSVVGSTGDVTLLTGDLAVYSGGTITAYSDAGTTPTFSVDGATGDITTIGTVDGVEVSTHDHSGAGQGGTVDHLDLDSIGTNSHAAIDTHIADTSIHFTQTAIDHGNLLGLADNDHTQYPLKAGTETITGVWTFNNGSALGAVGNFKTNSTIANIRIENTRFATAGVGSGLISTLNSSDGNSHTSGKIIWTANGTWTSTNSTRDSEIEITNTINGSDNGLITSSGLNVIISGLLKLGATDPPPDMTYISNVQNKASCYYVAGDTAYLSYNIAGVTEETTGDDRYIFEIDTNLTGGLINPMAIVLNTGNQSWVAKIYATSSSQIEVIVINGGTDGYTLSQNLFFQVTA